MLRLLVRVVLLAVVLGSAVLVRPLEAQGQEPCGVSALCLGGGRFQVLVFWVGPESLDEHVAHPVLLTPDSGYFWFFDQDNIEITVKALDGCASNGREWIFASGMTNLSIRLTVTDVVTGDHKTYLNPQGTAYQPIQDTASFANCPGAPTGPVAGTWTGTFDSADFIDCDSNTPAEAVLEQDGATVTGTLTAANNFCGPDHARISGTLEGDTLTGIVTGEDFGHGGTSNACVRNGLRLEPHHPDRERFRADSRWTLHLHR